MTITDESAYKENKQTLQSVKLCSDISQCNELRSEAPSPRIIDAGLQHNGRQKNERGLATIVLQKQTSIFSPKEG